MNRSQLAQEVFAISHLTGEFKLRSGKISHEYFDKYRFESQPRLLKAIAEQMLPLIPKGTEVLAALEMGGIPVGTALSLLSGLPVVFVRKEAKDYGTCQFAEGVEIKGKKLCIIEDVVTTGGQVLISTEDLRKNGALIENVLCVIFRGEGDANVFTKNGLKLHWLFSKDELKIAGGAK